MSEHYSSSVDSNLNAENCPVMDRMLENSGHPKLEFMEGTSSSYLSDSL